MTGRLSRMPWLVPCAICVLATCEAQQIPRMHVIVAAAAQRMADGDGERLRLLWTRESESGLLSAGASRSQVGSSYWTLMHLGGARSLPGDWTLSGNVDLGPARINGVGSTFAKFRAEASVTVLERWNLSVEEMLVDVGQLRGHLITGGSALTTTGGISFQARVSGSVQGNLDQQAASFRFDYRGARPYFLAGLALGRSNNRLLLSAPEIDVRTNEWFQAFVGVSIPLAPFEATIVAESARLGDVRRRAVSVAFRLPVGPSGSP